MADEDRSFETNTPDAANPQEDWGEPAGEGATYSSNHTRRGEHPEVDRSQGAKTRRMNKDIVSRRS